MHVMQPTTNRRMWWLVGTACLLVALIAVGLFVRMHHVRVQAQEHRQEGLQAAASGDHERAIGLLGSYLNHEEDDIEALYRFAQARRAVEQPQSEHLAAAATVLQRVVQLDPDHHDAARELADLYMAGGRYEEAIETADHVLEREPDDSETLGIKAMALRQLDRHDAAIDTATRAAEADPDRLEWHLMVLDLHHEAEQPQAALSYARAWHARHENDPRAMVVLAAAHQSAGRDREALQWLEQAAEAPIYEEDFVRELADRFDALGQYQRATDLIEQAGQNDPSPGLVRLHARRLWQLDRAEQLLAYLDEQERAGTVDDVELAAIETLASIKLGQNDRAAQRIEAMGAAPDARARNWAALLQAVAEPGATDPLRLADRASAVLNDAPANPEALFLLGQAYAAIDEPYAAISAWSSAAEHAPGWADPLMHAAEVARAHPQAGSAVSLAREAQRRAPGRVETVATLVLALAERTQVNERDAERLFTTVEQIQTEHTFEPKTLPLYVALLSHAGEHEQAIAVVRDLLESETRLPEQAWLRLARVTHALDAAMAERVLERSADEHGPTPTLALRWALLYQTSDDAAAGLQTLERMHESADADENDAAWGLARARYLEAIGDAEAEDVWTTLADRHLDDIHVQLAAVRAPSVHTNRALRRRALDRMEDLTGRRGYTWRLEHARWLADHPQASNAHLVEALQRVNAVLDRVPDHVEARLLAADCLRRLDNHDAALNHLHAAHERRPLDLAVNLHLAALLQSRGDFPAARQPLERFATLTALRSDQAWRLAAIADPLESATPEAAFTELTPAAVIAMRRAWQRGDVAEARDHLAELFQADRDEPLALPTLALAANYFAAHDEWRLVDAVVARLKDHDLPAGSGELLLAELHQRHGDVEEALSRYRQITQTTPENSFAWRERIAVAVARGQIDEAMKLTHEAQAAAPNAETWEAVLRSERVLRLVELEPELRALGVAIVRNPRQRDVARGVMELIAAAHAQPQQRAQLMPRLRALAGRHSGLLALQTMVVRVLHLAGEQDEAVRVARRAMRRFPGTREPADLAIQMLEAGEDWDTLIEVAVERKRLDPARGIETDALIAATYIRTDRADEAIEWFEPRVDALRQDPETYFDALATYAHALVAADRVDEAAAMMRPWLQTSPRWRQAWRWMAGLVIADAESASAWLEELSGYVPADHWSEHLDLVQHWRMLARRFDRPAYEDVADERLAELAQHENAPASVHVQRALAAERAGEDQQAEASYRRALELDAGYALAAHHLARLLGREERSLDEALELARDVAETQPGVPDHLDVLAFVATRAGRYDEALEAVEALREREQDQLLWQLTHAWVLVEAGEYEQAREIFEPIAEQLPVLQPLPDDMGERLARVHEALPELAKPEVTREPAMH